MGCAFFAELRRYRAPAAAPIGSGRGLSGALAPAWPRPRARRGPRQRYHEHDPHEHAVGPDAAYPACGHAQGPSAQDLAGPVDGRAAGLGVILVGALLLSGYMASEQMFMF